VRAVRPWRAGDPAEPRLDELPEPSAGAGEVLIEVRATALNRADLLQVRGLYPPPPGESQVPGLEAAGVVLAAGAGVEKWQPGDRVAALLAGGGHAQRVAAPAGQLLPIPAGWSFEEAAALPEAALTAWTNLVAEGRLVAGETVLVAGATSGVGSLAVELARLLGARVLAAGRDRQRLERLAGPAVEIVLLGEALPEHVHAATAGRGADLVLDLVGGEHFPRHLAALAVGGRLVLVGLMAGREATLDLGTLLARRARIVGSTLRPRPREEKAGLVAGFLAFAAPHLAARRLVPAIDRVFSFEELPAAYRHLERGRPFGKVVVRVGG
jgi:putative PIG3 family NAD(P)H quinone oxidoreductase